MLDEAYAGTREGASQAVRVEAAQTGSLSGRDQSRPPATPVLVSRKSVFLDRGEQVVFVAAIPCWYPTCDRKAERRVVTVGRSNHTHVEILEGLSPGEWVVISGQEKLREEQALEIIKPACAISG